jgi:hypothetical protein
MGLCVGGPHDSWARCFEWDTPVGLAVNLAFLISWVAVVVFFIRALRFGFREGWDGDDLARFAVTGRLNRLLLVVIVVGVGVIVLAILTT